MAIDNASQKTDPGLVGLPDLAHREHGTDRGGVVALAQPVRLPPAEGAAVLSMLSRVIDRPDVPVDKMEQMFDLYMKVQAEQHRKEFNADLVSAQSEMEPVRKNANNSQTKSNYATFDALDLAVRPIYTKYGFAPTYTTRQSDKLDHVTVVLTLIHRSGHEREYTADMPADGKGAKGGDAMTKTHAFGSAFSYGKRYCLSGAFNIITTDQKDDDGNAAGGLQDNQNPVTAAELAKFRDDLAAKNVPESDVCNFHSVETLNDLTRKEFEKAKRLLSMTHARASR